VRRGRGDTGTSAAPKPAKLTDWRERLLPEHEAGFEYTLMDGQRRHRHSVNGVSSSPLPFAVLQHRVDDDADGVPALAPRSHPKDSDAAAIPAETSFVRAHDDVLGDIGVEHTAPRTLCACRTRAHAAQGRAFPLSVNSVAR
jgi:hypothetical protein